MSFFHHAYYFEGPLDLLGQLADSACAQLEITRAGNPDVQVRAYDKFGIDESRELTQSAALRGVSAKSLYVIGVSSITTEAQQALLKLFEEPRQGLTFILLIPHGTLLPTLRSRMLPLEFGIWNLEFGKNEAKHFLSASVKERSEIITKILKRDDAREQLRNLLNEIESAIHQQKNTSKQLATLAEIQAMRPYLADRSPSLKMIFEHLAAVL